MAGDVETGRACLENELRRKKVLIVLDDVKNYFSCVRRVINPEKLCPGSRILLTSRDRTIFPHRQDLSTDFEGYIYELEKMDHAFSLQLFCYNAFRKLFAEPGFESVTAEVVKACDGLPLSLEVLGRRLSNFKDQNMWHEAITKLKNNKYKDISGRLTISYEALDEDEQEMFQDVACFLIGEYERRAKYFWNNESGLQKLIQLCLVKVDEEKRLTMHDHLRDLGRDLGKTSGTRIWNNKDLQERISNEQGIDKIRGVSTSLHSLEASTLSKMRSLRLLFLYGTKLHGTCNRLEALKIEWFKCLTWNPEPGNVTSMLSESLAVLDYHSNRFEDRVEERVRAFGQLKRPREWELELELHFRMCNGVESLPEDFGSLQRLEVFREWGSIAKLPFSSFVQLKRLRELDIGGYTGLEKLPEDFGSLQSLEVMKAGKFLGGSLY